MTLYSEHAAMVSAGQVNSKAMRGLFDAFDDNNDGCIDEGVLRMVSKNFSIKLALSKHGVMWH